MAARVVFVHGIGGPRDPAGELGQWSAGLADGMRAAGHGDRAERLLADVSGGTSFVYYGDLFADPRAQGEGAWSPSGPEAEILAGLLGDVVASLVAENGQETDPERRRAELRILEHAQAQTARQGGQQGSGEILRKALDVATTLLELRPWRSVGTWVAPKLMVRDLAQVARYLARGERESAGGSLDERIRARVCDALGDGPSVVVAHSLGTVVAMEALHEFTGEVPLFVTLGSPISMRAAVWPHLRPRPPATPAGVRSWLNFWDRDDLIAVRPRLEADVAPNAAGVVPVSRRVDSDGVWVHPAQKYLAQPAVAGPIAAALRDSAAGTR
ncbi:hypothetical protein J7F03_27815 [Streptomyces sp. ISL-43]|uniref:alpha/beta hydrolase n=1 Tax=Streptomyces sp. ISL-43 TaxID=2819183 RepID=UPI001BEC4E1B|nr:alpha/beta hydrolase [Streptomyces sp. ISL-43]MBT2450812.1 hypothetical protein [Streptomyces sp. ISL-43]